MSVGTEARIAAWQKSAGIEPAAGERRRVLDAMSDKAHEMVKIIELEKSGIRDGDGIWHGGDVIGGMASGMSELITRLWQCYDRGGDPVSGEVAGT